MNNNLPKGWKEAELGDICEIVSGSTPSTTKPEYWNGDINWVTPAEIENGHNWYYYETKKKITDQGLKSSSINLFPKGTVMLTSRAPIGKVAIAGTEMCSNQGFKNFVCDNKKLFPEYLYFWLRSKEEYLNSLGRGATFKEISKSIVSKIKIPLPPLSTQKKITSILEKTEKTKKFRREADILTQDLLQSIFVKIFGNPLKSKKWTLVSIGELTSFVSYGFTRPMPHGSEGIPIITSKNVVTGHIDFNNVDFTDKLSYSQLSKKDKPVKDDILYTKDGRIGEAAVVKDHKEFCISQAVAILRPIKEKINPIFFENLLNSKEFKRNMEEQSYGVALKHISITKLKKEKIICPPLAIQNKFVSIIKEINDMEEHQKQSKKHIADLFDNLIQKAFKGELIC